ncbi:MAG: hypothetical protein IPQ09_19520 [Myxococcales bacterium]|nr:hypothetical protein [Myxococcales bacterium]
MTSTRGASFAGPTLVRVPPSKLSAVILELAAPMLALYAPLPTLEEARGVLHLVIVLWNANVMAGPVWDKPEHREALGVALATSLPPPVSAMLEALDRAWHERYRDDPRVVGEWSFSTDEAGGPTLVCTALLPRGVTPSADGARAADARTTKKGAARRGKK